MEIMEIFTNWVFWVVLAAVVFLFAMIGFLAESKKKHQENKKESKKSEKEIINQDITQKPETTPNLDNTQNVVEDFSAMPEVPVQNMEIEQKQEIQQPIQENKPEEQNTNQPVENPQAKQPNVEESTQSQTVESNPNLPEIDKAVTEEAATLFNNEEDSDVWKV